MDIRRLLSPFFRPGTGGQYQPLVGVAGAAPAVDESELAEWHGDAPEARQRELVQQLAAFPTTGELHATTLEEARQAPFSDVRRHLVIDIGSGVRLVRSAFFADLRTCVDSGLATYRTVSQAAELQRAPVRAYSAPTVADARARLLDWVVVFAVDSEFADWLRARLALLFPDTSETDMFSALTAAAWEDRLGIQVFPDPWARLLLQSEPRPGAALAPSAASDDDGGRATLLDDGAEATQWRVCTSVWAAYDYLSRK